MLIRMLVGLSGSAFSLGPGEERDFESGEAIRLIEAGFAVPVAEKQIERAIAQPASEKRGRRGKHVANANDSDGN